MPINTYKPFLALLFIFSNPSTAANDAPTTSIATIWAPLNIASQWSPNGDKFDSYASIVAVDATATTYKIDCIEAGKQPNFDVRPGCSDWETVSMTIGPSTAVVTAIVSQTLSDAPTDYGMLDQTNAVDCIIGPSTAVCETILDGSIPELMEEPTGRLPMDPINGTDFAGHYQTYTITGGLEKLSVATATTTPVRGLSDGPAETGLPAETTKNSGAGSVVSSMRGVVAGAVVLLGGWLV